MTAPRQLALPFTYAPQFGAADFLAGPSNEEALAWLVRTAGWPQGRLALWGPEGSGKTHLLHVWAARDGAQVLAGPSLQFTPPQGMLAIDDADGAPELALLHTLNAAAEAGFPVLLSGREPPARWRTALPDLASRLRAVTAVEIRKPDDDLLRALLARLLAQRQLAVPEPVQDWLRLRLPRTAAAMREAAARLDRAALAHGGKVNRPLAAEVLAGMQPDGFDEDFAQPAQACPALTPALL
jgi:chromosomal replication initiation ATPase DnaA